MTLIEQLHRVLDEAFEDAEANIKVHRYRMDGLAGEKQREYIVLSPVSKTNTYHANDEPLLGAQNVDVKYYAERDAFDEGRVDLICSALRAAGLYIPNGTFYAESLTENNRLCAVTEVERMNVCGTK